MTKPNYYEILNELYAEFGKVGLITVASAAAYLGCDIRALKNSKLRTVKVGRYEKVNLCVLASFLCGEVTA